MTDASFASQLVDRFKRSRWRFLRETCEALSLMKVAATLARFERQSSVETGQVHKFNARTRDEWVEDRAKSVASGSRVLDVGAGTAP